MKLTRIGNFFVALLILLSCAIVASAQEREISFLVGRLKTGDKGISNVQAIKAVFDGAVSYQITYGRRFTDGKVVALYGELLIAGAPGTKINVTNFVLPKSYSSLFFTPGLKLQLFPGSGLSPYVAAGLGMGRYSGDAQTSTGQTVQGDQANTTWAFNYGAGVDLNIVKNFGLRGEIRDFITGKPKLTAPFFDKNQHNVNIAVGVVFKF
ncbi:MAG: outer membrane beta-barrel protein [Blastocatellia bacterium]